MSKILVQWNLVEIIVLWFWWRQVCVCEMYDGASKGPDFVMEDPTVVEAPLNLTEDLFLVEAPLEPDNLLRVSFLSELNLVLEEVVKMTTDGRHGPPHMLRFVYCPITRWTAL